MKRFCWDDFKHADNKDQKQMAKKRHDDYPAMLRYLMNNLPLHSVLKFGGITVKPSGQMRGGY